MSRVSQHRSPDVTPRFSTYLARDDAEGREKLEARNRAFLRVLLREHPDIAQHALATHRRARAALLAVTDKGPVQASPLPACRPAPGMAIVHEVAALHDLNPGDLLGRSQAYPVAAARFHAIYEIDRRLGYTATQIGALFKRNHTSVLHAINRWPQVCQRPDVVARLDAAPAALEAAK